MFERAPGYPDERSHPVYRELSRAASATAIHSILRITNPSYRENTLGNEALLTPACRRGIGSSPFIPDTRNNASGTSSSTAPDQLLQKRSENASCRLACATNSCSWTDTYGGLAFPDNGGKNNNDPLKGVNLAFG